MKERTIAPFSRAVFVVAGVKLVAHLLTASRYGFHRDELYFLAAADHPAWGYVDFSPFTPMTTALVRATLGDSLFSLRLVPALAGVAVVILTAQIARELGASSLGQNLSAVCVAGAPVLLGINSLMNTVTFDVLWWTVIVWLIVRLLRTQEAKLWVGIGAAIGVALLTKYTVLVLLASLAIAFLLTPERRWIGTRWLWIAVILAIGLWLPNLLWQRDNGWPTLEYLGRQETSATAVSRPQFLLEQVLNPGPLAVAVVVAGLVYLLRNKDTRALGIAAALTFVLFFVTGGKSYYTAAIYPLAFAGGGVATERWIARTDRTNVVRPVFAVLGLAALFPLPGAIPLLSQGQMIELRIHEFRSDYADMFGWEELARTVSSVYDDLPTRERARTAIVTRNYGEAAAVDKFGPRLGLPSAYSGHNAYYLWGPPPANTTTVVAIGLDRETLEASFSRVRRVATLRNPEGVRNIEYGEPVYLCRGRTASIRSFWERVKLFAA